MPTLLPAKDELQLYAGEGSEAIMTPAERIAELEGLLREWQKIGEADIPISHPCACDGGWYKGNCLHCRTRVALETKGDR